jgi:TRAP-type C4-dicarboxylate transport system substrate-binding protein
MELPFWTKTIPAKSGGAITAKIKPFNELGFKGGEVFNLVSKGTIPMAHVVLPYRAGAVPANESADLVGVGSSVGELQKAANAFRAYHASFLAKKYGVKLLGYGTYHSQVIYCRKAFKSIADLKGRKVRAAGASQQVFVKYLGGSPVSLAFSEVQPALANGVIDCAITGALSGYFAKWHQSAKFISAMPINHGLIAHMANLKWWNGLDPRIQKLLETQIVELETQMFALAAKETEKGLACNTKAPCDISKPAGMTLVPVTPADVALRKKALSEAVLPAFKKRCGAACAAEWNKTVGKAMGVTIK